LIKLSLIIPVYNLEDYIASCIDSILPQLTEETELILIDDGSTDDSAKIIKQFIENNSNVRYFYQENKRQGAARNNGLKQSKGEYIWFIDGDDLITDNAIETILSYEESHLNGHDAMIFEMYNTKPTVQCKEFNLLDLTHQKSEELIKKTGVYSISPCNKIIRRDFLINNNLFFEEDMFFEDNHFFIRFYNKIEIISSLNEGFYIRRERKNSTTRSAFDLFKLDSFFKVVEAVKNEKSIQLSSQFLENKLFWYVTSYLKKCFFFDENTKSNKIKKCFDLVPKFKVSIRDPLGLIKLKLIYNYNKDFFLTNNVKSSNAN